MQKLKKLTIIVLSLMLCLMSFVTTGCKKTETPEQMVIKVAQYIAEDNDENLSDVTFISGQVKEDEDEEGRFLIYAKIKVRRYNMYFYANYYLEDGEISYKDMTSFSSHLGDGYFDTQSLDIDMINYALQNI